MIVTLHVEISHDGTTYSNHPMPWIRVPKITHNVEFGKFRSLSVRIQWVDKTTGKWMNAPGARHR